MKSQKELANEIYQTISEIVIKLQMIEDTLYELEKISILEEQKKQLPALLMGKFKMNMKINNS
jgi:predicted Abi (CAAX) family protease